MSGSGTAESYGFAAGAGAYALQNYFTIQEKATTIDTYYENTTELTHTFEVSDIMVVTRTVESPFTAVTWLINGALYPITENTNSMNTLNFPASALSPGENFLTMSVRYSEATQDSLYTGRVWRENISFAAAFFANGIPALGLADHLFCEKEIEFTTDIQGMSSETGSLKWYIGGIEEVLAQDQTTWSKTFVAGHYVVKMEVFFEDGSTQIYEGTLNIGAVIAATAEPSGKGIVEGDGCYPAGETVELRATPIDCWKFIKWTDEDGAEVSTANPYTFPATEDRTLIAVFQIIKYNLNVSPTGGGAVIRQ
jgi:hypothetical protein